uniref:Uncharacterized protein n=1 Tax=Oryza sativa subsp. indica TaxID=39946 RepID=A0A679B8S6_ORYSI|nr:hypothetical protein [Oryza sativa Indica Group]BBD82285.1 hypothetical protein [Oryza sativa Indica Group]
MVNLHRLSKCLVMKAWRSPDVADPHGLGDPVAEEDEADPADEEFFQEQAGYDDCELGICPQPNMTVLLLYNKETSVAVIFCLPVIPALFPGTGID